MSCVVMKRVVIGSSVVGLLAALLLLSTNAWAAYSEVEIEQISQDLADTTMSPFCPGRTLSACPSSQARELRLQIQEWLEKGYTVEGVRNQLLTIYGDEVRGAPRTEGFGIMAWLVPPFVIMLTLLCIVYALRNLRAQNLSAQGMVEDQSTGRATAESDSELLQRVEKEVKKRMES